MKRSPPNVFSLAFLDVIACGFGAVILFFMIINTGSTRESDERTKTLHEEATRLEREVLEGRLQLVVLRNSLEDLEREQVEAQGRSQRHGRYRQNRFSRTSRAKLAQLRLSEKSRCPATKLSSADAKRRGGGTVSGAEGTLRISHRTHETSRGAPCC